MKALISFVLLAGVAWIAILAIIGIVAVAGLPWWLGVIGAGATVVGLSMFWWDINA